MGKRAPKRPKIYHITHVNNLAQVVSTGRLWSDAKRIERDLDCKIVGMSTIKRRRLEELAVKCHPGTKVGEYVPFYFCPRSIMLYIFHMGNHPELDYNGGQKPIIHLQADLHEVIEWANEKRRRWAFSDVNAGARYASFYKDLSKLNKINWDAVMATDFRDANIKDGKQAEFLLYRSFPWTLVEKIGVINTRVEALVADTIKKTKHRPTLEIERGWYF